MILASLLSEDIYRHQNGLKHINIVDNTGFCALFVVNTPVFNNSGVAHGVEHMVFRGSQAFPQPETLFQLTSLTDVKINASTFAETTYFHCQSQCAHTFMLAVNYLLNGLFNPDFTAENMLYEIHDGGNKGVIYRELLGAEHMAQQGHTEKDESEFSYGGLSTLIGELSIDDLIDFHQRFYHANNITLITANADVEQISQAMSLLPKRDNTDKKVHIAMPSYSTNTPTDDNKAQHQKKYSQAINNLITLYDLWLQDPYYQEIDDYKEIENTSQFSVNQVDTQAKSNMDILISPLVTLAHCLTNKANNTHTVVTDTPPLVTKTLLPSLLNELCEQAKNQLSRELSSNEKPSRHYSYVSDKNNALWLTNIDVEAQALANISAYIMSAYPRFLSVRCQGFCYATQALTIENSAFFVIYSAFDVCPNTRLTDILNCLMDLSQNKSFIDMSLTLAKIKYCHAHHKQHQHVVDITASQIGSYLKSLANNIKYCC